MNSQAKETVRTNPDIVQKTLRRVCVLLEVRGATTRRELKRGGLSQEQMENLEAALDLGFTVGAVESCGAKLLLIDPQRAYGQRIAEFHNRVAVQKERDVKRRLSNTHAESHENENKRIPLAAIGEHDTGTSNSVRTEQEKFAKDKHRRDGFGQDIITVKQKEFLRLQPCVYCGVEPSDENPMQADHLYPNSRGGWNVRQNFVSACRSCNSHKDNKTLVEWEKLRPDLVFHARMVSQQAWAAYSYEKLMFTNYGLEMQPIDSKWKLDTPRKFNKWAFGVPEPRRVSTKAVFKTTGGLPLWKSGLTKLPDECYSDETVIKKVTESEPSIDQAVLTDMQAEIAKTRKIVMDTQEALRGINARLFAQKEELTYAGEKLREASLDVRKTLQRLCVLLEVRGVTNRRHLLRTGLSQPQMAALDDAIRLGVLIGAVREIGTDLTLADPYKVFPDRRIFHHRVNQQHERDLARAENPGRWRKAV